ncbi:MAG: DUF2130 domain-containing protein [Methanobacteriota archaeon]|jgi:hypothetical protein|nr:MAG: DUF2130 domain-containing protein [Euryarchaeota archaeon]HIG03914.1 DUF2130 domain-containing protein [Candidatus Poseidoniales archaeon]
MKEINCPHCKQVFEMDAAGYADIRKQIKDAEFENELNARLKVEEEKHHIEVQLAEAKITEKKNEEFANKEMQIQRLKSELNTEKETASLKSDLAVKEATGPLQKSIDKLQTQVDSAGREKQLLETSLNDKYQTQIADRDEAIERLRDFKAKLSTKMLGETLEIHCENEFNGLRATAFPNAYFDKDNDVIGGTKGDYIFRDFDSNGTQFISIMFEMKNEGDTTATKKRNEDFLDKLDKDRNNKDCEFAILVSVLESDNNLYNNGIVDKSHRYPNMYVIRPQFFVPMITLLRNAALKSIQVRNELELFKNQNIDITTFENDLNEFKEGFAERYGWASDRFGDAIKQIDKSIKSLQDTKENLLKSEDHLRIANNKAQEVTVKRLTKNNDTMKSEFEKLSEE